MKKRKLSDTIINNEPDLESDMKTVAQQWIDEGMQKGIEQGKLEGKREGANEEKLNIAKSMLLKGYDEKEVVAVTDFSADAVAEIKSSIAH